MSIVEICTLSENHAHPNTISVVNQAGLASPSSWCVRKVKTHVVALCQSIAMIIQY